MSDDLIKILDGNTFVVSDDRGDIEASATDPTGLFSFDTRFLSTWVLTIDGARLTALSTDDLHYFETRFFLVPAIGTVYVNATMSVIRQRAVGDGFHERLTIMNHSADAVDLRLRIDVVTDFADLFEVKDALPKKGTYSTRRDDSALVLEYRRDSLFRSTTISTTAPVDLEDHALVFEITVGAHSEWTTELDVATSAAYAQAGRPQP